MKLGKRIYLFFLLIIGKLIDTAVLFLEKQTKKEPTIGFETIYAFNIGIYADAIMLQSKINRIKREIRYDLQKPKVTIE